MTLDELMRNYPGVEQDDDDYQYELYRDKQEQAEREAYEQHFADKY